LNGNEVTTYQIDGPKRQVFVKFANAHTFTALHDRTQGTGIYKQGTREISRVSLCPATMGRRNVRVADLPPEIPAVVIQRIIYKFGSVQEITDDKLLNACRY
jgi:hypothetical protein